MRGCRRSFLACCAALLALGGVLGAESVVNSKHNLSATGPGTVKAVTETQVCLFCHAPHDSSPTAPLWNRYDGGMPYTPYSSSTAFSSPGQPTGASKLCLSCHDGTIALGMVRSRASEILFPGTGKLDSGASFLGTDLSDDHPISFVFDQTLATQQGHLADPAQLTGPVRLDSSGQVQCTSCHDPHDDQYGKFLVVDNQEAALCTTCHAPPDSDWWGLSYHRLFPDTWNGVGTDPWPHTQRFTVADNSCENCHRPHSAASPQRLGVFTPSELGCLVCHNGNVAGQDLAVEFGKPSVHPVAATEAHEPREDLLNPPTRHAECVDCHNPHFAGGFSATLSGALFGVRGQSAAGLPLARVDYEHELCFRCHADSLDRGLPHVNRQVVQTNTRLEFSAANPSYHPVLAAGANPDVPSLIPPLTVSSSIACTDCHANDGGPGAGGTGPAGPHGSFYLPILERQLALTDGATESAATYALCYKCHDRESIIGNVAGNITFLEHEKHVTAPVNATCLTCHDPHGVQTAATSTSHLINFNPDYVTASSGGRLEFIDNGSRTGACYLTCHGQDHNPHSY